MNEIRDIVNQVTGIKDDKGNEVSLDEIKQIPWEVSPTPVTIVGTTFGNELQTRIANLLMAANFFLFYLCTVTTLAHLGWFK